MMLLEALREMLQEKGLDEAAIEWIVKDIIPRTTFLDGAFPSNPFGAPPGISSVFAMTIRKALDEIIKLEIELYQERGRPDGGAK